MFQFYHENNCFQSFLWIHVEFQMYEHNESNSSLLSQDLSLWMLGEVGVKARWAHRGRLRQANKMHPIIFFPNHSHRIVYIQAAA